MLFRSYQDRRCPCSCPRFVYAERNKGREQSVTQAVFVQTLTVRLSVSSAPLMSRVCPAVPGKGFPVPLSLAAQPAFFRIHEDPSAPPHGSSSPWTLCKVQAGRFAIQGLACPCVPLTRDWQKACVAPAFRARKKSDFRCHLVLHAGHQTLLQASGQIYQPVTQTQYS